LNFYHYLYSVITLMRNDGGVDNFKLEEEGYSQIFVLSNDGLPLLRFRGSLNPLLIDKRYEIEVIETSFPDTVIEELILYAGEILYRKIRPGASPL